MEISSTLAGTVAYPAAHCAPEGPASYLLALCRFLTYPKDCKAALGTSLQAIEFGGRRKWLGGLLEEMPGAGQQ